MNNIKSKYLSSAILLLITGIITRIIGALYKIPLTSYIGATGRGYFANAYNLCLPIHVITMGAFPVALSRLVSKYVAKNDNVMVASLKKVSNKIFFVIGIVGMAIMLLLAKPYAYFVAASPKCIYTILVLAPSMFFCTLAASYRAYYEGFLNMVPTSISQLIEAGFKAVFGIAFARVSMSYWYNQYVATGTLFGEIVNDDSVALSMMYPYTSAAAMLGVTVGSFFSLLFLLAYNKINYSTNLSNNILKTRQAGKELLTFSVPILVSCAVQSFFQFIDTSTVQLSLSNLSIKALQSAYAESINISSTLSEDTVTYVFGLLNTALDFKNLVPGITMALGVSAVPAISSAMESEDSQRLNSLINSVYKYTMLISCFAGAFIALNSKNILLLFYSSSTDIVVGCESLVRNFGLTIFVYSLSGSAVYAAQAIGYPEKSIAPYVVSGVVRALLNIILITKTDLMLNGVVVSGFVGYLIIFIWNIIIVCKYSKTKFNFNGVLFKPLLVTTLSCIIMTYVNNYLPKITNNFALLCVNGALFIMIYALLCTVLGAYSILDLKSLIICKKKRLNTCNNHKNIVS